MSAQLQIELVKIGDLERAAYNPRRISPQALAKLKASLRDFGFVDPAIANRRTGVLIGGHQRIRAWEELGNETVPVVWVDVDEVTEKAMNVALNNAELTGTWDVTKLVELMDEVKSKSAQLARSAGFEDYQLDRFRRQVEKMKGAQPVYPLASRLNEHYDYVVIFCENATDFVHLRQLLGVTRQRSYKKQRRGIGRVIGFRQFLEAWESRPDASKLAKGG